MAEREGENLNMTDYENWLLSRYDSRLGIPFDKERLTDERWVNHVKADLPMSDFTWEQYEFHVKSGFGDEWFFAQDRAPEPDSEEERPPGKTLPNERCLGSWSSFQALVQSAQPSSAEVGMWFP
jgi:hypothetical protein